jgi:hypothetical protein
MARPRKNNSLALRSRCHAVPRGEPECRIPLFAVEKTEERAGKASVPQVSSGPDKPAHAPEIRPSVAAAIPAYAAASLSSR